MNTITAYDLKIKYEVFRINQGVSDTLLERSYADPDNEELDAFSDKAYDEMWKSLDRFADALIEFTDGRLDRATIRRMALAPKYSGHLEELMRRIAA